MHERRSHPKEPMENNSHTPFVRMRRGALAIVICVVALIGVVASPGAAVTTAASSRTSDWLAAQVSADGSVNIPGETFSTTTQTMYVAQGLAASGEHRDALARAIGYLEQHVNDWVTNDGSGSTVAPPGSDLPERLGSLILLVRTIGADPRSFGVPATDLVARTQALYGIATVGLYGYEEPYSAVQDQSLVVMALAAVGVAVPPAAVQWIVSQQCTGGGDAPASIGGWMSYRAPSGGGLVACTAPDPINYTGADTNSTAFALQALTNLGTTAPVTAGLAFLHAAQTTSGAQAGGFPWFTGGDADPNSTALVIQAILAVGEDPAGGAWSSGGQTPVSVLPSWQLTSPASDAGSLYAAWQPGVPSLLATYQGLWGMTLTKFPFPILSPWPVPVDPVVVVPTFTG